VRLRLGVLHARRGVCSGCGSGWQARRAATLLAAGLLGILPFQASATLEAAAAAALRRRNISFQRVAIESAGCIPAPENCQSYSSDIVVVGERPARGRIVCREPAQRSVLWIAELDLRGVAVPDPAVAVRGGWVEVFRLRGRELRARFLP